MKPHILFVDDDFRVLSGLRRMLYAYRDQWKVNYVSEGEVAIRLMEDEPVDVVVSDLRMEAMDGVTFLDEVKSRWPDTVRLVLSAYAPRLTIFRVLRSAHCFLVKPCDPDSLISAITSRLEARSQLKSPELRVTIMGMAGLRLRPSTYKALRCLLAEASPSPRAMADLGATDAILAAELLRFTLFTGVQSSREGNDALFPMLSSVGLDEIRRLMEEGILRPMDDEDAELFAVDEFAAHSVNLAHRMVTAQDGGSSHKAEPVGEGFIAGLLHDIGKVAFMQAMPILYSSLYKEHHRHGRALLDAERATFGATHAEVGSVLLTLWGFPWSVIEAVAYHPVEDAGVRVGSLSHGIYSAHQATELADGSSAQGR